MSKNMKVAQLIKVLKEDGWIMIRMRGSHRQFKHSEKQGLVTISGKPSDDMKKGTLGNILRQAKLKHTQDVKRRGLKNFGSIGKD